MNYSTLKKGLVASLVAVMGVTSLASAQEAAAPSSSAKVFASKRSPFIATNKEFGVILRVSIETELHFKNKL